MSTLASKLLWSNFLVIQIIFDLHIYRKFLVGSSLIINITAVCIPCNLVAILGKGFITFYIFDSFQVRYIGYISLCWSGILQPVRHGDVFYFTFCSSVYIYGFFLGYSIVCFLCCSNYRCSSKDCSHSGSHCNIQNLFISVHVSQLLNSYLNIWRLQTPPAVLQRICFPDIS